jgi:nicotinamide mononucleotide adenylyltransferase
MTPLRRQLTLPRSSLAPYSIACRFTQRNQPPIRLPLSRPKVTHGWLPLATHSSTLIHKTRSATMTTISNRDIANNAGLGNTDTMTLENYTFPSQRLRKSLSNPKKQPLVLVSCGSFSPPTNLHLRMFEEAADYCEFETEFEVLGGFFSPVGDAYKKAGLASAQDRINMTRIAVEDSSTWIGVDQWEPLHKEYLPTVKVLDHFDHELNEVMGGIEDANGNKQRIHVALLAGADLIQTMSTPGLWASEDLNRILGHYGAFILERSGTDIGTWVVSACLASTNIAQTTRLSASSSSETTSA